LLLMQMGAHPLTPTNTGTLDKAVMSEPSSISMGGMNSAVMTDNAATGAFYNTATGAFYNTPWSMLDSPAADSLNSSPVTAPYGTGMDLFSYGTEDGSIGSEPLDAWDMSGKRSVKRVRGKLTDTSRHKHRLDGLYKHCCLEWRACMGIYGGVLFAL
jgi:hypothetical protein